MSFTMNALTNGLTARSVCLNNESKNGFQQFADSTLAQWTPTNEVEYQLVQDMVVAKWSQLRYWGVNTATIDREMAMQAPEFAKKYAQAQEIVRQADAIEALNTKSNNLQFLQRSSGTFGREYFRAQNQLLKIREKNVFPKPDSQPPRNEPSLEPNPNIPNTPPAAEVKKDPRQIADGNTTYVRETPKIGRNELCACGSGIKFKKCCLDKAPGTTGPEVI